MARHLEEVTAYSAHEGTNTIASSHYPNASNVSPGVSDVVMRLLSSVLIVMALAVSPQVTMLAASKGKHSLIAVDAGSFTFTGQTSASINGDAFEKQGPDST